jgi:type IV pilus assembly protein PilB
MALARLKLKLGEILVKKGLISPRHVDEALKIQATTGQRVGDILVEEGYVARRVLEKALEEYKASTEVEGVVSKPEEVDPSLAKLFPEKLAKMFKVVPLKMEGGALLVASPDVLDISTLDYIRFATGHNVKVLLTTETFVESVIGKLYSLQLELLKDVFQEGETDSIEVLEGEDHEISFGEDLAHEAPVIRLVNYLIADALGKRSSDIHMEPYERRFRVRFRVDGVLYDQMDVPLRLKEAVVARVKIMSNLDIMERRVPQDGRIKVRIKGQEVDIRVSIVPTVFGEKVVMRLLSKSGLVFDLTPLGFEKDQLEVFVEATERPYGMVLLTGPTGSGKTTTLYSALVRLNSEAVNIMTAEDPVEYNFEGINQVQIREDIGFTFATAMRAFLRQDPDIILVGEIRDHETADIAVKAALTGHLVFSTLHTNDAPSTVTRLVDMEIEPFLVASSLNLVVAQRLVRRVCPDCRREYAPPRAVLEGLGIQDGEHGFYKGGGCSSCNDTGYKGRIALYEVMPVSRRIMNMVLERVTADEIRNIALEEGMATLREMGIRKAREGMTTLEEVMRVTA